MRKIVFTDHTVAGHHIELGILRLENMEHDMRKVVIRALDGKILLENPIPVPEWAVPFVFDNWSESLGDKIVWPIKTGRQRI